MHSQNASKWIVGLLLLGLAAVMSGCSTFNRDWKKATAEPFPSGDIAGAWEGHWISEVNGHNGRLRALITKDAPGKYNARFHAKYRRVLSFSYAVPLDAQQIETAYILRGETTLPWWAGGRYEYDGKSTPSNFFSTYNSKHDHGTFEMSRP